MVAQRGPIKTSCPAAVACALSPIEAAVFHRFGAMAADWVTGPIESSGSGWVCELTVEGVAQSLADALNNSAQRQLREQRAQAYAGEYYDWSAIAHKTLAAYKALFASSAH